MENCGKRVCLYLSTALGSDCVFRQRFSIYKSCKWWQSISLANIVYTKVSGSLLYLASLEMQTACRVVVRK